MVQIGLARVVRECTAVLLPAVIAGLVRVRRSALGRGGPVGGVAGEQGAHVGATINAPGDRRGGIRGMEGQPLGLRGGEAASVQVGPREAGARRTIEPPDAAVIALEQVVTVVESNGVVAAVRAHSG